MALLVCRTCPRDRPDSGSFGVALDARLGSPTVRVRHVPCLGGCPRPGNAGLDAMGKPRVRFSGIDPTDPDDAAALVEAAARYDASPSGLPGTAAEDPVGGWDVPSALCGRLTAVTPKRIV